MLHVNGRYSVRTTPCIYVSMIYATSTEALNVMEDRMGESHTRARCIVLNNIHSRRSSFSVKSGPLKTGHPSLRGPPVLPLILNLLVTGSKQSPTQAKHPSHVLSAGTFSRDLNLPYANSESMSMMKKPLYVHRVIKSGVRRNCGRVPSWVYGWVWQTNNAS